MRHNRILLLDCNPAENIGDILETILKSSRLNGKVQREVIVDPNDIRDGLLGRHVDHNVSLMFLIPPSGEVQTAGALIRSIKEQHPDRLIIVVIKDCGPAETLELLRQGASDFLTLPLKGADTLARTWRLLEHTNGEEKIVQVLKERVPRSSMTVATAAP